MTRSYLLKGFCLLGLLAPVQFTEAATATVGPAAETEARQIAGNDPLRLRALALCNANPDRDAIAREEKLPAARIFDDLYFVGNTSVSAWLWRTNDGFVLIDTLGGDEEAHAGILAGMEQFGVSPEQIKLVIITHGHSDHSGGARLIREKVPGARLAMTEQTYRVAVQSISRNGGEFPRVDLVLKDGMRLPGGMRAFETPGHSPGTTSLIFPVRSGGRRHVMSLLGGSASYRLSDGDLLAYSASARRFADLARSAGVEFVVSNHQAIDSTRTWIDGLARGQRPMPLSAREVSDYYRVVDSCARSHL